MLKKVIFPVFLAVFLFSCGTSNKFDTDVSGITYKPAVFHWEDLVFAKPLPNADGVIKKMREVSPALCSYYLELLHIPEDNDTLLGMAFLDYAANVYMKEAYTEIKKVFKSTASVEQDLVDGFKRVKYHFPKVAVPANIVFMHTAFGFNVLADTQALGISLELYLGANNPVTQKLPDRDFPDFIKKRMEPEYIAVDVMKTWAEMYIVPDGKPLTLLDNLISHGKIMYVLDALMPHTPDHVKIRYTEEQFSWCTEYQKDIWKEIIDNKWLYSSDAKVVAQFFNEGPFTPSLPQNSPSRAGVWVGWQMVRSYMEANSELKLDDLLNEKDNKKILSYYKPD
ncbi:MAG: hypothetical protein ACHQF2_00105 [Flavobacteriales bacterium]